MHAELRFEEWSWEQHCLLSNVCHSSTFKRGRLQKQNWKRRRRDGNRKLKITGWSRVLSELLQIFSPVGVAKPANDTLWVAEAWAVPVSHCRAGDKVLQHPAASQGNAAHGESSTGKATSVLRTQEILILGGGCGYSSQVECYFHHSILDRCQPEDLCRTAGSSVFHFCGRGAGCCVWQNRTERRAVGNAPLPWAHRAGGQEGSSAAPSGPSLTSRGANTHTTPKPSISTIIFISYGRIPTSIYIVQKSCYYSKKYGRQNNYPSYSKKRNGTNPFILYFIISLLL